VAGVKVGVVVAAAIFEAGTMAEATNMAKTETAPMPKAAAMGRRFGGNKRSRAECRQGPDGYQSLP